MYFPLPGSGCVLAFVLRTETWNRGEIFAKTDNVCQETFRTGRLLPCRLAAYRFAVRRSWPGSFFGRVLGQVLSEPEVLMARYKDSLKASGVLTHPSWPRMTSLQSQAPACAGGTCRGWSCSVGKGAANKGLHAWRFHPKLLLLLNRRLARACLNPGSITAYLTQMLQVL